MRTTVTYVRSYLGVGVVDDVAAAAAPLAINIIIIYVIICVIICVIAVRSV